jgi:hypothetical protein
MENTIEEKIVERAEVKLRLDKLVIQQGAVFWVFFWILAVRKGIQDSVHFPVVPLAKYQDSTLK